MKRLRVAFGPEAPAFGSWEWVGADLCQALAAMGHETTIFRDAIPDCDVIVIVKFKPSATELRQLRIDHRILIYFPVDLYDSAARIDLDSDSLRSFHRIIVHCERLRKYFSVWSKVEYLDHHLKFVAPQPSQRRQEGPLLWIGNRSNLQPVIDWTNQHSLSEDLWILTDFPADVVIPAATALGFRNSCAVRIERWTPERHLEWTTLARAALDVKGDDFRARHKPPTKALDFLASGVPLAMYPDSSSTEHLLKKYEFQIAGLEDHDHWLSADYWQAVQQIAPRLKSDLSLEVVAARFVAMIQTAIFETL